MWCSNDGLRRLEDQADHRLCGLIASGWKTKKGRVCRCFSTLTSCTALVDVRWKIQAYVRDDQVEPFRCEKRLAGGNSESFLFLHPVLVSS